MSYCKEEGKDKIMFLTEEELSKPSTLVLPEDEESPGLILPSGEINWECPCLGGMATGPCGSEFRDAFSCFHYSQAEPKGSDCYEKFKTMTECMQQYPSLYGKDKEGTDTEEENRDEAEVSKSAEEKPVETQESSRS